jgi:ribosomal protein S18 acetylase RimI-like enzyme
MTTGKVEVAAAAEESAVVAALTLGFGADPVTRWCWDDPGRYLRHFPRFIQAFGGKAFAHGTAHRVDGYAGAALWLPPGIHPDDEAIGVIVQSTMRGEVLKDMLAVAGQIDRYHPKEPHWYLPLIAVDPSQQGRGHGSALLKHALALCDRERIAAYLESTNPRNNPLYQRHGFEQVGVIQAGNSPPLFPMLRKPR